MLLIECITLARLQSIAEFTNMSGEHVLTSQRGKTPNIYQVMGEPEFLVFYNECNTVVDLLYGHNDYPCQIWDAAAGDLLHRIAFTSPDGKQGQPVLTGEEVTIGTPKQHTVRLLAIDV